MELKNDAKLVRNPYGIKIEFNNSPDIVNGLIGVERSERFFGLS